MSWSSGSELMDSVIDALKSVKDANIRKNVYAALIPAFEDMDCDTLYECRDRDDAFATAYDEIHPEEFMSFCITGTLKRSREEWIEDIESCGHTYSSQVKKGLTYLVMAEPNLRTTKSDKAAKLGVKCISEDQLAEILGV
jgi:NAD-dependent DNA ligase